MTSEQPKQLDFTRDGELVYLQSSFALLKQKFEQEKLSLKARDKIFLEVEALITRYQENFSPSQDDQFLMQMLKMQHLAEEELGRTFFEQMYQDCVDKFQKESSLIQDRETLAEIIDIIKRYRLVSALRENDPLLLKMDNLAEQIRGEIQGDRYLQRLGEQYLQQFLLNKSDSEKCEQIIDLAENEYQKIEKKYGVESLALFQKNIEIIKKQYAQMVESYSCDQLQQISFDLKISNDSTARNLIRLEELAQKVEKYAFGKKELLSQISLLKNEVNQLIIGEQNDLFVRELSDIQRQLLYSHSEQDYQRILELLDKLKDEIPLKYPKLLEQELFKYRQIYDSVQIKYLQLHRDKFKQLFIQLKNDISTPGSLEKLKFLIKKYDFEYQAIQNKDPFFYEMLEYERQLEK